MPPTTQKTQDQRLRISKLAALIASGVLAAASAIALSSTAALAASPTDEWVPTLTVSETQCATPGLTDGAITLSITDTRASGESGVTYDISVETSTYIVEHTSSITLEGGESRDLALTDLYGGVHVVDVTYKVASGDTWSTGDSWDIAACDVTISPAIDVLQQCTGDATDVTATVTFAEAKPYSFGYRLYKGGRDNIDDTWHTVDGSQPVAVDTLTANAQGKASFILTQSSLVEGAQPSPLTAGQTYTLVIDQSSDAGSSVDFIGTKTFTVDDCDDTVPVAPEIDLSVPTAAAGDPVTVSVTGAQPNESLDFVLHSTPVDLGTVTADADGKASLTFDIPANIEAGPHTVTVDGVVTHLEQQISVTNAGTANPDDEDSDNNGTTAPGDDNHKTPSEVQTDGNPMPMLWLTGSVLLMGLLSAGGAGLIWRHKQAQR